MGLHWAPYLLAAPLVYLALLWLLNGPRRAGEAPLERGRLPWLGAGLEFGADPLKLLQRLARTHAGSGAFQVWLGGKRVLIVSDPTAYQAVMRDARRLDMQPIASAATPKLFGPISRATYDLLHDSLHPQYPRFLAGKGLEEVTARVQTALAKTVTQELGQGGGAVEVTDLYGFVQRVVFPATADAMMGAGWCSPERVEQFRLFDLQLPAFVGGVPEKWMGKAGEARKALRGSFRAHGTWDPASFMYTRSAEAAEMGVDADEMSTAQLGMFWASQGNTIPATFWCLYNVLADPKAREAVEAELAGLASPGGFPVLTVEQLRALPVVNSVIDETLRMRMGTLVAREAKETFEFRFPMENHPPITIYKGTQVSIFPPLLHMDPEVFEDPATFRFDRFLDPAVRYSKGGLQVKTPLVNWGGGATMCPGRHLARNEIAVLFVYLFLACDFELLPGEPPEVGQSRSGLGVLHPAGAPQRVRVGLRRS